MKLGLAMAIGLVTLFTAAGCSQKKDESRLDVIPVKGEVHVDGKPVAGVLVQLVNVKGMDPKFPTSPSTLTDAEGKFEITTYDNGDGAPAGEYTATFTWKEIAILNQDKEQPDKLKDKYSNPASSQTKVKVESTPVDMGKIELTTK